MAAVGCGKGGFGTGSNPAPKLAATKFQSKVVEAARKQIGIGTGYDGSYLEHEYPNGEPPTNIGVCTDVVVRALRPAGFDLQRLVHEDMLKSWREYPRYKGIKKPDANIDHRRVPNLRVYFKRHAKSLTKKLSNPKDWQPGDVVTWKIGQLDHVGILSDTPDPYGFPLVIHNAGAGPEENDALAVTDWTIDGHFRVSTPEPDRQ